MSLETFIKWLSGLMIVTLFAIGAYLSFHIFIWDAVYEEIPIEPKEIKIINAETGVAEKFTYTKQEISKGKPYAMLLLGVDTEDINHGRSDTIVLAIAQPEEQKISLLSIPRDTYLTNQHTGRMDKVNHSYNHGITNTIETLEKYFHIPIDYYATVNMDGFIEVVDAIGGLEINVEKDLTFYDRVTHTNFSLEKGTQNLSGIEALNYARFRGDAEGDFGRNRRQRQVITQLIKQSVNFQSVSKINDLVGIMEENFRTNIKPTEMGLLLKQTGFGTNLTIESIEMDASPGRRGSLSVVLVAESERAALTEVLQTKLKLNGS